MSKLLAALAYWEVFTVHYYLVSSTPVVGGSHSWTTKDVTCLKH